MAVATYIVPVEDKADKRGGILRDPAILALAHTCKGYVRGMANIPRGALVPYTLFTVEADDFGPLDADPRCVLVGKADRFANVLASAKALSIDSFGKKTELLNAAQALNVSSDVPSVGDLAVALLKRLEPAAHPEMYDSPTPDNPQTITDDFNRASLGSGWEAARGTIWVTVGSSYCEPVSTNAFTDMRRSESSFPNDQYSQCKVYVPTGGDGNPGVAVRCGASPNGNCYNIYFVPTTPGVVLRKLQSGTNTYLNDWVTGSGGLDAYFTLKLDATGTTLTIYFEGSSLGTTTDSDIASGRPGLFEITGTAFSRHDDFECTDASGGHVVAIGQNTETDTAQAFTHRKTKAIGQVTETDTAQAVTRKKVKAIGQPSEVDSAQALTRVKAKAIGQPSETDTAQAVTASGSKVVAITQASETDSAQALGTTRKVKGVAQASETDAAQTFTRRKAVTIGQTAETDAAFAFSRRKTRAIAQAAEIDFAGSMSVMGGGEVATVTLGEAGVGALTLTISAGSITLSEAVLP